MAARMGLGRRTVSGLSAASILPVRDLTPPQRESSGLRDAPTPYTTSPASSRLRNVVVEVIGPEDYAAARGRGHVHVVPLYERLAGGENPNDQAMPYFAETSSDGGNRAV